MSGLNKKDEGIKSQPEKKNENTRGTDGRTIGQRIGLIRERKNYSQQDLADALGVPRENVRNWENDTRELKANVIVELTKVLGVSADYLLGISEIETQDPSLREVCDYSHLSENAIWLARNNGVVSDALNYLAAKFDGENIHDVPLYKFASAFLKVVNASCSAFPMVNGEIVDDGARRAQLGTALYQFNRTCIDIPNSVLLSDETLEKLETLREDLEIKEFYALLNAQKKKEVTHGEHQED